MILVGPVANFFRSQGPLSIREFPAVVERLRRGLSLNPVEAHRAIRSLLSDAIDDDLKVDFLLALHRKGETAEEIATFALTLRELAVSPHIGPADVGGLLLDVCGSGGDKLHTFNISTAVAFVVAGAGVPVAKHGNRAITSQSGSADVLEALGVVIDLPPRQTARCLQEVGMAFFFAPHYHRAFKHVAGIRKRLAELGESSVFNILGPLLGPARPNVQLIGVYDLALVLRLAEALRLTGARRGMVVCGRTEDGRGMDEFSTLGPTRVAEFAEKGVIEEYEVDAASLGLPRATLADIAGSAREQNADLVRRILNGTEHGFPRDIVVMNAAAAFHATGTVQDYEQGLKLAAQTIDIGQAAEKLERLAIFTRTAK
ncbi:MAG: anthranilate phosphoribosyltransferase [Verrucomicrobia bacterium]|nr:anthranilate phosphoribosyltransferase [Verrucomicrobiota bacterium]